MIREEWKVGEKVLYVRLHEGELCPYFREERFKSEEHEGHFFFPSPGPQEPFVAEEGDVLVKTYTNC